MAEYIARGPVSLERLAVEEREEKTRVIYRSSKVHPRHVADFRPEGLLDFDA